MSMLISALEGAFKQKGLAKIEFVAYYPFVQSGVAMRISTAFWEIIERMIEYFLSLHDQPNKRSVAKTSFTFQQIFGLSGTSSIKRIHTYFCNERRRWLLI
jgi:hypothetical protein